MYMYIAPRTYKSKVAPSLLYSGKHDLCQRSVALPVSPIRLREYFLRRVKQIIIMSKSKQRDDGQPEDPAATRAKNKRVQKLQAEVDEVAVILHTNVDKLLERGEKLDDLMDNADGLLAQASSFQTTSKQIKTHYKWKNRLYKVIGIIVVLLIIAVIVVCIIRPWEAS